MFTYRNTSKAGVTRVVQRVTLAAVTGLALTGAVVGGVSADPSTAQTTVTGAVQAGGLTASIAVIDDLGQAPYSLNNQTLDGELRLTVDDATGFDNANTGWNVTVQATDFDSSTGIVENDIDASNLVLTDVDEPVRIVGQQVDAEHGPLAVDPVAFSLDTARKINTAEAGYGNGRYSQDLGVELTVPGMSRPSTYTSLITITYAAAP